ncbi:MAG: NUDIX hydrolase [Candidatus Pacearchaeota archaeon]|nr:NUDIX hydrolase [Candidatus Pacearchaeota archaeon]
MKEIIAAAVIKDRKILLVDNRGFWGLPGGTKKEGESDEQCLKREFAEEFSGTKLKNLRYYKSFEGISPRNKDIITVKIYFAEIYGLLIMPDGSDEDIKTMEWATNIEAYNMAPVAKKIISSLRKDCYL